VRSGALRRGAVLGAAILFPIVALLTALAATVLWGGITVLHPVYALLLAPYNSVWYALAMTALTCGLATLAGAGLQRWINPAEQAMGAAVLWLVLLALAALAAPGASYLLTWPLLPLLAAQGWLMSARGKRVGASARLMLLCAAALPGVLLFGPLVQVLFTALTMKMAGVVVLVLMLLLGVLAPLLALLRRRWVWPALPMAGAAACLVAGSLTGGVSERQPAPDTLVYMFDGMSGKASWLSSTPELDSWLKPLFGAQPRQAALPALFGADPRRYWNAPAPVLAIEAPRMDVLADRSDGKVRSLTVHLSSPRQAPLLRVHAEGVQVLGATLQGKTISATPQKEWAMSAYGLPAEGADLVLQVAAGQPFKLRMIDRSYGLPSAGQGERARDMMIQPFGASDSVQAVRVVAFE
jgi:hypothetical protein